MTVIGDEDRIGVEQTIDPTTFSVVFNALNSVVEEMSLTFEHSAWSSILSQCRDFSCAIYDASVPPNALCVFDGLPIHVNAQPVAIAEIAKFFGDDINDGDVIMVNCTYFGTTHIGDLVIATPIFYEGKHLFWAAATGHQMDVGSPYNTSVPVQATDVWKEGFQISPLKLEDAGRLRKDVLELYLQNMRYRDFIYGDLMSQVGSVKTGKRRVIELLDKWGTDTLRAFSDEVIDYADRRTAAQIATFADGTYTSEAWVDSDGTGQTNMTVRCKMTISGSQIHIDFDGSDPQARGGVNASWATCQNAASTPVLACLDPDVPHNQGCLRHITVSAPKGTITNVEWPGATADATIVPADSISDAVWKCLAQAAPDKAVAGYGHIAPNAVTAGLDRRSDAATPFGVILFNGSSGGGACLEHDGWPLMYCPAAIGGLKFVPVEVLEMTYPLVVHTQEVRIDSMGAGRTRGGPGLTFTVEPRGTGQVDNYPYGDGMFNPPFGVFGGLPGDGGALYRNNKDGTRTFFSMISYFRVREGESWVGESTGGGGYGDPLERDPERVRADVRNGFVSTESAERDYGVVIDGATNEIDAAATTALRAKKASGPGVTALVVPDHVDAGTYYRDLMRDGDGFELDPHPPLDADFTL
ncbi:hydantoinase B/oxoprolinase family protein [Capillimicrobium parvum]|uniref:Acetophenone carboxylase delta subunit n=1 Tax=Capillimicrobium parvum TaxID=2884022 RepID=A0A9E6Y1D2_9ACTN|nr:hydantoinase B/oxoprolinase family protein [Capillimicrobium parvum]UGS38319.1 Acetophenone carboxylase delta subunit [Capillimicrobium parvum]